MAADAIVHVIDDDEAVRQSIEFLLRTSGVTARTYDSAAAFLDVLPTIEAGCIITDVRMPGISGIDLLRRLGERQIRIPVIVITGHGDVPLAVEAMKSGAVDFLESRLRMSFCSRRCARRSTAPRKMPPVTWNARTWRPGLRR